MTLENLREFLNKATGFEWTGKIYTGIKTIQPKTTEELMKFINLDGSGIHSYYFLTELGHEITMGLIVTPTRLEKYSQDISSDREGSRGDWVCTRDYSREWLAFQKESENGSNLSKGKELSD